MDFLKIRKKRPTKYDLGCQKNDKNLHSCIYFCQPQCHFVLPYFILTAKNDMRIASNKCRNAEIQKRYGFLKNSTLKIRNHRNTKEILQNFRKKIKKSRIRVLYDGREILPTRSLRVFNISFFQKRLRMMSVSVK